MGLVRFVRYLVISKLSGSQSIDVLKLLGEGYTYREIANITGLRYAQVKGYMLYAMNLYGSSAKVRAMIKYLMPIVEKIEPIVKDGWCLICNTKVDGMYSNPIQTHINTKHRDLVDAYERWVMFELYRTAIKT